MATNKPLSPSQIAKLQEVFGSGLRKANPFSDAAQDLIENSWPDLKSELEEACVAAINRVLERKRVEAASNMIVRHAKVNRARTPQRMLDALNRQQYVESSVVESMPRGQSEEDDVHFFQVGKADHYISDDELEKEYELCGFVPADPYKVAVVNEDDPAFADKCPNVTHWKDAQGRWCYLACRRDDDERRVFVRSFPVVWGGVWWFGGVRK